MTAYKQVDEWELFMHAIAHGDKVLAWGPPGTGKTYGGWHFGNPKRVYAITCTDSMPAAEIRGHWIPGPDGQWIWMDGPGIKAWDGGLDSNGNPIGGSRLLLNEIDHADTDMHSILHGLLDDFEMARMTLPNNETVSPEPGFSCVATMNGDPGDLPEPLLDRFQAVINITMPHPNAIASLPADLREPCRRRFKSSQGRVSVRAWKSYAMYREHVGENIAAQLAFGAEAREILDALTIATSEAALLAAKQKVAT